MPSVNSGPSNSATVNTQTPAVASQASAVVAGLPVVTQAGASAGTLSAGLLVGQTGIPVGIAGTGTIGANGALTLGTALIISGAYVSGIYFYFPAGAVFASSAAGFYFTKMTSTTAGTVFNNTYVAANGLPSIPTALVPVVDAGPGAYTGVTTIQTGLQFTVPANVLGNNGALYFEQLITYTNSAGAKTFTTTWGGTNILTTAPTTTQMIYQFRSLLNRGVQNLQITAPASIFSMNNSIASTIAATTVDTTQSSTVACVMTAAAATDNLVIEFARVLAFYVA
jgi:hypothetical protein